MSLPPNISVKNQYLAMFEKRHLKTLVVCCLAIASLFSILDFRRDLGEWSLEIGRNLVIAFSIGSLGYCLGFLAGLFQGSFTWRKALLSVVVLLVSGWLGAWLAWWLNIRLFGFQVSSLNEFRVFIALLTIPLGLLPLTAFYLLDRLHLAKLRRYADEAETQRLLQAKTRAELETLRAKVQPHFLFNSLNSIASLIPCDPEKAETMVEKLSVLLRHTLNRDQREFASFREELEVVEAYLAIEQVRLGPRLTVELACEDCPETIAIPHMLLQPLVENAVLHGIAPSPAGGFVRLVARYDEQGLAIECSNTCRSAAASSQPLRFGLQGIMARLDMLYGDRHQFQLQAGNPWIIRIHLPNQSKLETPLYDSVPSNSAIEHREPT